MCTHAPKHVRMHACIPDNCLTKEYVRHKQLLCIVNDLFSNHDDSQLLGQLYETSAILALHKHKSHDCHMTVTR